MRNYSKSRRLEIRHAAETALFFQNLFNAICLKEIVLPAAWLPPG
jgi:hypothetical protein